MEDPIKEINELLNLKNVMLNMQQETDRCKKEFSKRVTTVCSKLGYWKLARNSDRPDMYFFVLPNGSDPEFTIVAIYPIASRLFSGDFVFGRSEEDKPRGWYRTEPLMKKFIKVTRSTIEDGFVAYSSDLYPITQEEFYRVAVNMFLLRYPDEI